MVFQAEEAEPTRIFLKAILDGKGIRAECTLRHMPSAAALSAATKAAVDVLTPQAIAQTAEMAGTGLPPPLPISEDAIITAGIAHMSPLQPTLQSLPRARSLFLGAISRAEPLWFHPSPAEQLVMAVAAEKAANNSAAAASSSAAAATPVARSANNCAEQPPINLLAFVQFVSIAQPATSRTPAIPSVVICNTPLPASAHSRFGTLDPAAVASFASALAASAAVAPPSPLPTRTVKIRTLNVRTVRKPPIPPPDSDEEMKDTIESPTHARASTVAAASSARVSPPREVQFTESSRENQLPCAVPSPSAVPVKSILRSKRSASFTANDDAESKRAKITLAAVASFSVESNRLHAAEWDLLQARQTEAFAMFLPRTIEHDSCLAFVMANAKALQRVLEAKEELEAAAAALVSPPLVTRDSLIGHTLSITLSLCPYPVGPTPLDAAVARWRQAELNAVRAAHEKRLAKLDFIQAEAAELVCRDSQGAAPATSKPRQCACPSARTCVFNISKADKRYAEAWVQQRAAVRAAQAAHWEVVHQDLPNESSAAAAPSSPLFPTGTDDKSEDWSANMSAHEVAMLLQYGGSFSPA